MDLCVIITFQYPRGTTETVPCYEHKILKFMFSGKEQEKKLLNS